METFKDVLGEMVPLVVIIFVLVPLTDAVWNKIRKSLKSNPRKG